MSKHLKRCQYVNSFETLTELNREKKNAYEKCATTMN